MKDGGAEGVLRFLKQALGGRAWSVAFTKEEGAPWRWGLLGHSRC